MEERILELVSEVLGRSEENITYREGIQLNEEFLFDSLMVVEFISKIEDEFNFEFDLDVFDVDLIYDLDAIIKVVKQNI